MQIDAIRNDPITISDGTFEPVASLPEGYRPKVSTDLIDIDSYSALTLRVALKSTGTIIATGAISGQRWRTVHFSALFFAG